MLLDHLEGGQRLGVDLGRGIAHPFAVQFVADLPDGDLVGERRQIGYKFLTIRFGIFTDLQNLDYMKLQDKEENNGIKKFRNN